MDENVAAAAASSGCPAEGRHSFHQEVSWQVQPSFQSLFGLDSLQSSCAVDARTNMAKASPSTPSAGVDSCKILCEEKRARSDTSGRPAERLRDSDSAATSSSFKRGVNGPYPIADVLITPDHALCLCLCLCLCPCPITPDRALTRCKLGSNRGILPIKDQANTNTSFKCQNFPLNGEWNSKAQSCTHGSTLSEL